MPFFYSSRSAAHSLSCVPTARCWSDNTAEVMTGRNRRAAPRSVRVLVLVHPRLPLHPCRSVASSSRYANAFADWSDRGNHARTVETRAPRAWEVSRVPLRFYVPAIPMTLTAAAMSEAIAQPLSCPSRRSRPEHGGTSLVTSIRTHSSVAADTHSGRNPYTSPPAPVPFSQVQRACADLPPITGRLRSSVQRGD